MSFRRDGRGGGGGGAGEGGKEGRGLKRKEERVCTFYCSEGGVQWRGFLFASLCFTLLCLIELKRSGGSGEREGGGEGFIMIRSFY